MVTQPALPVEISCVTDCLHVVHEPAKVVLIRVAQNPEDVYLQLYNGYYSHIKRYAMIHFQIPEDLADDILQNVFLKLWERKDRLRLILSPDKYLFVMASNFFIQSTRQQRRKNWIHRNFEQTQSEVDDSTDREILYRETRRILETSMKRLPLRMRQIYMMKNEGYKLKEIATQMGICEQTVKNTLQMAHKKMDGVFNSPAYQMFGK